MARLLTPPACILSQALERLTPQEALSLVMSYADSDWLRLAFEDPDLDTLDAGIAYLHEGDTLWPARVFLLEAAGGCRAVYLTQQRGDWFTQTQPDDRIRADQMGARGRRVQLS